MTVVDAALELAIVMLDAPLEAVHFENEYPVVGVAVIVYALPFVIPVTVPETVLPFAAPETVSYFDGIINVYL